MPCGGNYMRTFNSLHEYPFSWTIDNFTKTPTVFQGPSFCPISEMTDEFCFEMEFVEQPPSQAFRQPSEGGKSYLRIFLRKLTAITVAFNVECNFTLQNTKKEILIRLQSGLKAAEARTHLVDVDWNGYAKSQISKVCAKKEGSANGYVYFLLVKDTLVMEGKLILTGFLNSITSSLFVVPSSKDREDLFKDFQTMYRSGLESDITINIGEKKLFANKGILCCRSPVFRKMFDHSMKERRSNIVDIEDIEFHVFDCFIMYLYTGEIEDKARDTVLSLYSVADKYEVKSLHSSCSRILASGLSVESVCSVLLLSVLHNDEELKTSAINFISWHFNQVADTSEWAEIVFTKPQLASEILKYFAALKLK